MKKLYVFLLTSFFLSFLTSCSTNNPDYLNMLLKDWTETETQLLTNENIEDLPEYKKFVSDFNELCKSTCYDDYLSVYFDNNHNYFLEYSEAIHSGIENKDINLIRSAVLSFELISKNQSAKASKYYIHTIVVLVSVLLVIFIFLFVLMKHYEKEIENSRQMGVYAAFVMNSVEKERHRISKEIHDTVLQNLRFVLFKAEELNKEISQEELENTKKSIIEITEKSISDLRNTCQNLTPSELKNVKDENTLITAIRNLCQKFQEQYKIQCVLSIQNNIVLEEMTLKNSMNLFRIIQEALNNIQQHAKASYVSVVLKNNKLNEKDSRNHLVIYITDDGKGFDVNSVSKHKHFGITNMKERAKLIGAQFSIQSDKDTGTEIILQF